MADLGKKLDEIESLKDKKFKLFGISMTPTTIGAAVALLGSVIGMLYAGFVMYQKIDSIANLDVGAFENKMKVMEAKIDETTEYTRDIKNGLRDDILRIEQQADRTEDLVRKSIDDVRNMISDAESRFETKRDSLRQQVTRDTKEIQSKIDQNAKDLEDRLN